jgi:hypothetical protein
MPTLLKSQVLSLGEYSISGISRYVFVLASGHR